MTEQTPTDAQQYLNVASQCAATATSELAKNVLVDEGSGTLRELLNDAADAIRAGWGSPVVAGEPFGYFHQLLDHEGNGNGVWLGTAKREVTEQAHTPGETGEEIVTLYTTPQAALATQPSPTAQAAESVPAVDRDRIREIFMAHGFTVKEGQTDLKQYVYDAAEALLRAVRAHYC